MSVGRYQIIEEWTEQDLLNLPDGETDEYEFKSSRISEPDLKKEIQVAASAFWNSGGGVFIAGLDDNGTIDGGLPDTIGRQRLRDWVDRAISRVEPSGPYMVKTISPNGGGSAIQPENVVLVIAFGESHNAPHMAPDKRYYIRAGTHSDPASHFIVEAIRLRRRLQKPVLRGVLRMHQQKSRTVELVVLAINDAPALDVELSLELPASVENGRSLPLLIPAIDQRHPFTMEVAHIDDQVMTIGDLILRMKYEDVAGRAFEETQILQHSRSIGSFVVSENPTEELTQTLTQVSKELKHLRKIFKKSLNLNSDSAKDPEGA